MILHLSILYAGLAVAACTAAAVLGDWALRCGAALIGAGVLAGLTGQIDSAVAPPTLVSCIDGVAAAGLAVLLATTDFRAWIPPALGAQLVIVLADLFAVVVDGRRLPLYFRGVNLLHVLLIGALVAGTTRRIRTRRPATP